MAKTSSDQLLIIDFALYMLIKINSPVVSNNGSEPLFHSTSFYFILVNSLDEHMRTCMISQ